MPRADTPEQSRDTAPADASRFVRWAAIATGVALVVDRLAVTGFAGGADPVVAWREGFGATALIGLLAIARRQFTAAVVIALLAVAVGSTLLIRGDGALATNQSIVLGLAFVFAGGALATTPLPTRTSFACLFGWLALMIGLVDLGVFRGDAHGNVVVGEMFGVVAVAFGAAMIDRSRRTPPRRLVQPIDFAYPVLACALLGTLGWMLGSSALIGGENRAHAIQLPAAIALGIAGTALWLHARGHRRLAQAFGALLAVIATAAILQNLMQFDFGIVRAVLRGIDVSAEVPQSWSVNSASALLICGISLVALPRRDGAGMRGALVWACGVVVASIAGMSAVGHALGIDPLRAWSGLASMAAMTTFAVFALAAGLIAAVQSTATRVQQRWSWIPAFAGILVVIATMSSWGIMNPREDARVRLVAAEAAVAARDALEGGLRLRHAAFERLAMRVVVDTDESEFVRDTRMYFRDFPALRALRWIDSAGHRWMNAGPSPAAYIGADDVDRLVADAIAADTRAPSSQVGFSRLADGRALLLMRADAVDADGGTGTLDGAFDVDTLFANALGRTTADYTVEIRLGRVPLYASRPTREPIANWTATQRLDILGHPATMTLAPTRHAIAAINAPLPLVVLFGGLVLGGVLALILRLAGLARDRAAQAERVSVGLQREMKARVATERALEDALARAERQSQQLRAINRGALLASAKLGDGDLMQVMVEELRSALGTHLAAIHLLPSEAHEAPRPVVSLSDKYAAWRTFDEPVQGLGLLAEASRGSILRLTQDQLLAHPRWREFGPHADRHPPLRGLLSVPLRDRANRVQGFLLVSDRHEGDFGSDDEAVVVQFAQIASLSLGWSRLIDELRGARAALHAQVEASDRHRRLLDEAERVGGMGSWEYELDREPHRYRWSNEALRMLGQEESDNVTDVDIGERAVHPDDRERVRAAFAAAIEHGEGFELDSRIVASDGRVVWVHSRAIVERAANGRAARIVGVSHDITERRLAEHSEAARAEILRGIAMGAPLSETLDALARLFEARYPGGLCQLLFVEQGRYLHPIAGPSVPAAFSAMVDGLEINATGGSCGTAAWRRERVIVSDIANDPLWAHYKHLALPFGLLACWSTPIIARTGDVVGTFAVYYREARAPTKPEIEKIDVLASIAGIAIETDLAKRRIEESEQRFRSLFANVPEAVFALDLDGRIVDCNDAALALTRSSRSDLIGQAIESLAHVDDRSRIREQFAVAAAGDALIVDHRGVRADGSQYDVIATTLPIVVDDARVGVFSIQRDVTAQREAQAALERAMEAEQARNRELQEFAYVASHDLQEPLRKIQAFGDRLRIHLGDALDADAADYVERMRAAAGRMQRLIDAVLAYSRVTTRHQPVAKIALGDVLTAVLEDLETRIEQTGARIESDPLPTMHADPIQMHQMLQNLIGNALKFKHPERAPHVRIAAEQFSRDGQPWMRLRVTDNGIGFENRHRYSVFAPFTRLHSQREFEGAGIGLTIVRRIVERHHGTLGAEGRPGEGSTFTVELPLELDVPATRSTVIGGATA